MGEQQANPKVVVNLDDIRNEIRAIMELYEPPPKNGEAAEEPVVPLEKQRRVLALAGLLEDCCRKMVEEGEERVNTTKRLTRLLGALCKMSGPEGILAVPDDCLRTLHPQGRLEEGRGQQAVQVQGVQGVVARFATLLRWVEPGPGIIRAFQLPGQR